MCFNIVQSSVLAGFAFLNAGFAYYITRDIKLPFVIAYFGLMETLQIFQYMVIDQCDNPINKFLTIMAYVHVSFQPCMPALAFWAFSRDARVQDKMRFLTKIAFFASLFLLMRLPLAYVPQFNYKPALLQDSSKRYLGFQHGYNADGTMKGSETVCGKPFDMMRGSELCTFTGRRHLAWSVPLAENAYYVASISIHCFFFFAPFLFISHDLIPYWGQVIIGLLFFLTGPFYASFVTDDVMEQPALWCFYSVLQVIMIQLGFWLVMGCSWAKLRPTAAKKEKNL